MKVVLADVEEDALRMAEVEMREGFDVLGARTDVSQAGTSRAGAAGARCVRAVHILCNNAGVAASPGRSGRAASGTGSG
jgi:NADP-dependent 3-hydroxy acid dehydrogenase YdfG